MEEKKKDNMYALLLGFGSKKSLTLYVKTEKTFNEEVIIKKDNKGGEKKEKIKTLNVNVNELENNPSDLKAICDLFGIKLKMFQKIDFKKENKELKFQIFEGQGSYAPIDQPGSFQGFSALVYIK